MLHKRSSQFDMNATWTVKKIKPAKNSGLNWIQTHDACHISAALFKLSYQAKWKLVNL